MKKQRTLSDSPGLAFYGPVAPELRGKCCAEGGYPGASGRVYCQPELTHFLADSGAQRLNGRESWKIVVALPTRHVSLKQGGIRDDRNLIGRSLVGSLKCASDIDG